MNVDLKLQYNREHIKETLLNDIVKIDRDGRILNMEPFPSLRTLALLASAVYSDGDVDLPEGWKLLTTVSNKRWGNGYVGAAYLNPSLQQVVVSHRGTIPTNTGALWTNIMGVVNTIYTPQMNSAVTFADKIMSVLCEVNEEKGAGLQLSVTGHSLGGWLGQVTAFTLQNVRRVGDSFTKIHDRPPVRHAHTVTFDTPGCRDMLGKIIDHGYNRYEKTVSPDGLDITNYLAPPNRINTTGHHVGTIHLVDLDLSNFGKFSMSTPMYNYNTHKIDNFVKAFGSDSATDGAEPTHEVLDWPVSSGALGGPEYWAFHARVSHETNYEYTTNPEEEQQQKAWKKEIRYKTEKVENSCENMRVFCGRESYLLELWRALKTENVKMTEISAFVTEHSLGTVDNLFAYFDIENRTLTCRNKENLRAVVRRTKQLMRWLPGLLGAVERQGARVPRAGALMYRMEARNYLASLPECPMRFEDTIGLKAFLESGETRILHIATENGQFQVSVVYKLLSQMSQPEHLNTYFRCGNQTFMDWKRMQDLEKTVDFISLYSSGYSLYDLLVVDLTDANQDERLSIIFKQFLDNETKKLIIISSQQSNNFVESLDVSFLPVHCEQFKFDDLTEDSKEELFSRKMLVSGGKRFALADYTEIQHVGELLSRITDYTGKHELKKIMTDQNYEIQMEDPHFNHDDLKVHSMVNKEVSVERVVRVLSGSDALLVVSGIGPQELETDPWKRLVQDLGEKIATTLGDGEAIFKQKCREEPSTTIYWFSVSSGLVYCKSIYKNEFYIKREFVISRYIFDLEHACEIKNKKKEKVIQNSIFVFLNVKDKQSLISRNAMSEENKLFTLESSHIQTAISDKEADDIIKDNPDRPVHVLQQETDGGPILWQRSRGSLEGLRPCVKADTVEPVDEENLRDKEVVIISDEPGMGKSTTLTNVARLLRPAWVVRVDLKDLKVPFEKLPDILSLKSVCEVILSDDWLRGILHFYLNKEYEHSRKIYILFDGFDEIKRDMFSSAEGEVLRLLEYLHNETTARVWVTTRLYRREILENALSTFAIRFARITESQQRNFLVTFWRSHLLLEVDNYGDVEKGKLDECAERVYKNAKKVLGDNVQHFISIPLQMRMLADVCLPWMKDYLKSKIEIDNIIDIKNVLDLYQHFVNIKYDIYFGEKRGPNEPMGDFAKHIYRGQITEQHRMLGLRTLFPKFAKDHFDKPEAGWGAELCRVGLVQGEGGRGEAEFTHRTLAEYFCADLVVEWLRRRGRYHGHAPVAELLFTDILLQDSHRVTGIFIDNLIISKPLSEEVNKLSDIWRKNQYSLFNLHKQTALHVAVKEGSAGIVELLLGGFRCAPEELIGFLAAQDWVSDRSRKRNYTSDTALGRAARAGRGDMVRQIVGSVERCSRDVILELLLATYVSYSSVSGDEIKVLSNYLQETAVPSHIQEAFSRTATIIQEYIPALLAAMEAGSAARVGAVCRELASGTEMLYCLLGKGGELGKNTPLHLLAKARSDEESAILTHISTTLANKNISAVGRVYNGFAQTPLHTAAALNRPGLVEWLINHGVWVDCPARREGFAIWMAARKGSLAAARCLMEKGAKIKFIDECGDNLLFAAALGGSLPLLENLIEKQLDINIINNNGENLLFPAVKSNSLPVLQFLIDKGLDVNCVNNSGQNILHGAHSEVRLFLQELGVAG